MPPDSSSLGRRARRVAGRAARRAGLRSPPEAAAPRGRVTPQGRRTVLDSPLFDQHWVEVQLGRTFGSRADAVDAYLDAPDVSPHPLFFIEYVDPRFGRPPRDRNPLLWYLNHARARRKASPHPLVDLDALAASDPAAAEHRLGPLVGWLERATPESVLPTGAGGPITTLGEVAAASERALRRWRTESGRRLAPRTSPEAPRDMVEPGVMPAAGPDGTPLVSIVMPLWNRATVVREAIESVQRQTFRDWELIVVDDGSTDDSVAVVRGLAAFDPRIVVVEAGHHGVSAARNRGLDRAVGRYVAFLDTDNQWRPAYLQVMLAELEAHPDWGMAHAALRATKDGEVYFRAFEGTHAHLLVANHVDLNVLVARRDLVREVGGFDETLRRGVDYDLVLKMAAVTGLHLVRHVGVDYTDDSDGAGSGPRISTHESPAWLSVIASRHLVDWDAVRAAERRPGHTTLVLTGQGSVRALTDWLHAVAGAVASGAALDAVVVGVRLPRWQHVVLAVLADVLGHATLVTIQADRGAAVRANVGLAAARGERVVLVLDPVQPDADAVLRLAGHLDDSPGLAQPVVLAPTGEVLTAGAVFDPDTALPQPFLAGHAVDDAARAGRTALPAADGPVVALRAADLGGLDGLDPLAGPFAVADLALRAAREGGPATVLQPDVRLVARTQEPDPAEVVAALRVLAARHPVAPEGSAAAWHAAGFDVTGHRYDLVAGQPTGPTDHPVLRPRTLVTPTPTPAPAPTPAPGVPGGGLSVSESAPALRWAIDLASPVGAPGRAWGDTHYGEALAAALRRRGQHVAVDARDTRHRPSRDHDDVVLVLRGLDLVRPRPGRVNLEWIISHPDLVTPEEVAGFDRVFAASHGWSEQVSSAWGVEVRPLLQATDPSLFHPRRAEFDTGADVLFVGNSRGIFRSSVRHATSAGIDVTVHGAGWTQMLPPGAVASLLVDNADLGALYTAAGLVLNDHWEDMRLTGFVSNRLMDAAASGARVASDEIPGLDLSEVFGGLVQTWRDEHDLARIVRDRDTLFPRDEDRVRAAEAVAARHSFDARADELLDEAVRLVRARESRIAGSSAGAAPG